jgi:hypothetical protein
VIVNKQREKPKCPNLLKRFKGFDERDTVIGNMRFVFCAKYEMKLAAYVMADIEWYHSEECRKLNNFDANDIRTIY